MAVKRYDGSAWQTVAGLGAQGAAATSSSIATWVKTASGGETSLSGNDDNSQSLSYTVGQELVFINGTLLKRGSDYTATNGTSITGLTALAANDVATVWTVNAFSVTNAISNTIMDAKGDLLTASSADVPARLAVGANDTVLTADSSTATGLKWAAAGGYTLLTSGAFSGTTLSITSIPATYKELVIFLDGYDPTDDGDNMRMRFNQDSTANRHYASLLTNYVDTQAFNATSVDICRANDNTVITNNIVVRIPNYATTAGWKRGEAYSITVSETTTTSMRAAWYALYYNQTTAISSLDFVTSGANTFAVNYKVYGVA